VANRALNRRSQPAVLAAVALGGALGTLARYGVAQLVGVAPDAFPWATFATNISGSFAIGSILALVLGRSPPGSYVLPFLVTGFLGAYTTFSTFAVDIAQLTQHGRTQLALVDGAFMLLAGLMAAWAGIVAGRAVRAATAPSQRVRLEHQHEPLAARRDT